ncbi:MAG: type II toxin-antitoxin system VapC family toxin [Bradymonadaceae bacterium]
MIVADANLLVYLLLPGEHSEAAEEVLERDATWCAPLLWRSEFRNVLAVYLGKELLTSEAALRAFREAERLVDGREFAVDTAAVLELIEESSCSAYDCEYVALARELEVPVVTSDREMLEAFPGTAVDMETFDG